MSHALPITKLHPPELEDSIIARPRLLENLCDMSKYRLALIVAPAGSGKTILLTQAFHLLQHNHLCAWLSCDGNEAEPATFLRHLVLALQTVLPAAGHDALEAITRQETIESALSRLINDLAGNHRKIALFIDHFQEAENPACARLLSYLLRYLPKNTHLLLASRRNLLPALSWARARDWTLELTWDKLFFTPDESIAYLRSNHRTRWPESGLQALSALCGGWIVALQLAMRTSIAPGQAEQEKGLSGDFAAPLMEEVLRDLPENVRIFLLETAPLEELRPSLCDAVRQADDSRDLLRELDQTHALIRSSHDNPPRYPHLLSNFLRSRLKSESPERFSEHHERAGDWFASQHLYLQALRHWQAADARQKMMELLENHGRFLLSGCEERHVLQDCLDHLSGPPPGIPPALQLLRAWCALLSGHTLAASLALNHYDQAADGESALLHTLIGVCRYDWPGTVSNNHRILNRTPTEPLLQAASALASAHCCRYRDQLAHAGSAYRQAAEVAETLRIPDFCSLARFGQGSIDLLQARPDLALQRLDTWLEGTGEDPGPLHLLRALSLLEQGQITDAHAHINTAISCLERTRLFGQLGLALTLRATIMGENGDADAASQDLSRARNIARPRSIGCILFHANLSEARLCLKRNAPEECGKLLVRAQTLLEESGQSSGENFEIWLGMRCTFLLAMRRFAEARDLAQSSEHAARNAGRLRHAIGFLVLRASALTGLPGQVSASRDCLEQARTIARPGGVSRPFQQFIPNIDSIHSLHGEHDRPAADVPVRLPERLHQREEQILRLLEQGLRNREIAARLFLSDETVKWYLKRLYGNFAVANRVQLLATIRKLGLLGDSLH